MSWMGAPAFAMVVFTSISRSVLVSKKRTKDRRWSGLLRRLNASKLSQYTATGSCTVDVRSVRIDTIVSMARTQLLIFGDDSIGMRCKGVSRY